MNKEYNNFAANLNSSLLRVGVTSEACKQLTPQNMEKLKSAFSFLDPYVQTVLIQSVIYLSTSQFNSIAKDYFEMVESVKDSSNEWVRRKAYQFSEFPKIKVEDDLLDSFDLSALDSTNSNSRHINNNNNNNSSSSSKELELFPEQGPPNKDLPPPKLPPQQQNKAKAQLGGQTGLLSIPEQKPIKPPTTSQPPKHDSSLFPQREKKKIKIQKDFPW